ncbi:MAG: hypothetical protein Q9222_003790 [Ikaeria aurantiellina]
MAADAAGTTLVCGSRSAAFNQASPSGDLCAEGQPVTDCCRKFGLLVCLPDGSIADDSTFSSMGQNRAFCKGVCHCDLDPELSGILGEGAYIPDDEPVADSPFVTASSTPPPRPSATPLIPADHSGPGGMSCQEWNKRVAANPYLGQEVRPKIDPCPPVSK